jgi:hypothetical protein
VALPKVEQVAEAARAQALKLTDPEYARLAS